MQNVAIGALSGEAITTGIKNTIIGTDAGDLIETGQENTIIGYRSDVAASSDTNCIAIGAGATGEGSNSTVIGSSATTKARVFGLRTPVTSIGMGRSLTANDSGETFVFSAASGATITLPDSGGGDLTGVYFNFFVKTQVTSNSQKVVCADTSNEKLIGSLHSIDTDADASASIWNAQSSDNFSAVTLTGVATGKIGSYFTITNMAADIWHIKGEVHQSGGSEATPFATS